MRHYPSWGRYPRAQSRVQPIFWRHDPLPETSDKALPRGLGRSYGDSCLNDGGVLFTTEHLDRLISFDDESGLLACEPGVTLQQILELVVPRGWFLPVTPGTQHVTIGGAIANDVHGKNHHVAGCFGNHVTRLELLRSTGERLACSPSENEGWFRASIGGMGLTGLITWAELQLIKVNGPWIENESIKLRDLEEFFDVSAASQQHTYTVAWIDSLARGKSLGRGIFFRGEHAPEGARGSAPLPLKPKVPFDFPAFALNRTTTRAFNTAYYATQARAPKKRVVHYQPFFYPLDVVEEWNRVYGKRGFVQYQCVVEERAAVHALLDRIARDTGSFLTVLKVFGDVASPGMMSFPRPGVTLALDFPFEGQRTLSLCDDLDAIVREAGGALYPAKDARMSPAMFELGYPRWREFSRYLDPRFSSSFWRRVCPA